MKFKLIDQYTVRCVLTEHDLIENNIKIEDFFSDREKVHNFLDVIMNKAKDEIGYELNEEILSMQIMPLPKKGLAITISGKNDKDINELIGNVKSIADMLEEEENSLENEEELSNNDHNNLEDMIDEKLSNDLEIVHKSKATRVHNNLHKHNEAKDGIQTIYFKCFKDIEEFCKAIQKPKYITSHLYKNPKHNDYYMIIEQGRLTASTFNKVRQSAVEFGDLISKESIMLGYIKEYCEEIIYKKAIATIRKIASV